MLRNAAAALLGLAVTALPALGDMTQPAQPEVAIWAYPQAENNCPTGLQPVRLGGVVYCGVPTHTGYGEPPAPRRADRPAYSAGYSDYIAYSKSPGETN